MVAAALYKFWTLLDYVTIAGYEYAIAALISRYIAHDQLRNDADTLWHHAITLQLVILLLNASVCVFTMEGRIICMYVCTICKFNIII